MAIPRILPDQSQLAALAERLAALEAENARLRAKADRPRSLTIKTSAKGAVSVYGMGRWPVTLYQSQWAQLLGHADQIKQFIQDHQAVLAKREED